MREEIVKEISFARNLSFDDFKDKEEFYNLLLEHKKRLEKMPAVGTYDPHSPKTKIDIDFSKALPRWDPLKEEWERE